MALEDKVNFIFSNMLKHMYIIRSKKMCVSDKLFQICIVHACINTIIGLVSLYSLKVQLPGPQGCIKSLDVGENIRLNIFLIKLKFIMIYNILPHCCRSTCILIYKYIFLGTCILKFLFVCC